MMEEMRMVDDGEDGMSFEEAVFQSFAAIAQGYNAMAHRVDELEARVNELESERE